MRIVQIIDSLNPGGAENMAVNYANSLLGKIEFCGLIVTREEGLLKQKVDKEVSYLFLNKNFPFDLLALFKLRKYIVKNKIQIVHTHGTSYFMGFLIKIITPNIKLVWHEHYGNRISQKRMQFFPLYFASFFFSIIFVVNHELEIWTRKHLLAKNIFYIRNFPIFDSSVSSLTDLKGTYKKRIVCLANLKNPKNHLFLLKIALKVKALKPDWTFHLVGKDYEDEYSKNIIKYIKDHNLQENVFIYSARTDVENILSQSTIAILTSESEGLPVSILEYGLAKKAVVATNVGEINAIIQNNINGFIVESNDVDGFCNAILKLIDDDNLAQQFGINLNHLILTKYSQSIVMTEYLKIINSHI
jgi:glycosyltransferase involved in cell wall biosynthesis